MVDRIQVQEMTDRGVSAPEIAEALGVHVNTVRAIIRLKNRACVRCGKTSAPNKTMCIKCMKRDRDRMRESRKQRRKEGVCIECGGPRVEGNRNFCEKHRYSAMKRNERYYAKRNGNSQPIDRQRTILDNYGEGGWTAWQRDKATCQSCGFTHTSGSRGKEAVHLHHIDENRTNNAPDNFICLCFSCHRAVHELLKSKNRKHLLVLFERIYPDRPLR